MKSIESLYNKNYSNLSENELYIFDYIMKNTEAVSRISITDLAKQLSVSKSTISRFTQKIGFSGFSEFKFYLTDITNNPKDMEKETSVEMVMDDIEATYKLFNQADVEGIIADIYKARNVFCYGTGWGQRNALDDLRRSMIVCNKYTVEISAHTELEMISRVANESDVLIIAITSSQVRLLTRIAKYTIYFQTITIPYKNDEMVSFLPVSLVTNMLFLKYFDYVRKLEPEES